MSAFEHSKYKYFCKLIHSCGCVSNEFSWLALCLSELYNMKFSVLQFSILPSALADNIDFNIVKSNYYFQLFDFGENPIN